MSKMDPAHLLMSAITRNRYLDSIQKSTVINAVRAFNCVFSVADASRFGAVLSNLQALSWRGTQTQLVTLAIAYLHGNIQMIPLNNREIQWFYFKGHRWHRLHNGHMFRFFFLGLSCLLDEVTSAETSPSLQLDLGIANAVVSGMASILSVIAPGFASLLDSKLDLICFENGVYDMTRKVFRVGRPDDFITRSTGYDYIKNHHDVEAVKLFIHSLFNCDDLYDYVIKIFARALHGKQINKLFVFFGLGSNGKSSLARLLLHTGGFCGYAKLHGRPENTAELDYMNEEGRGIHTTRIHVFDKEPSPSLQSLISSLPSDEMVYKQHPRSQPHRVYDQGASFVTSANIHELVKQPSLAKHCIVLPFGVVFARSTDGANPRADHTILADKVKEWGPAAMSLFLQVWEENDMYELDKLVHSLPPWKCQIC